LESERESSSVRQEHAIALLEENAHILFSQQVISHNNSQLSAHSKKLNQD
jgi:hypothetical protein